jgi:hypothetical protein
MHSQQTSHRARPLHLCIILLALAALATGGGCQVITGVAKWIVRGGRGAALGRNPSNPFADIKTIAILPFNLGQTTIPIQQDRAYTYAEAFASELAQCKGFTVVRAYEQPYQEKIYQSGINAKLVSTADQVAEIGRTIQADAVIICKVTDYDPYNPPRLGIEFQMFKTADYENVNSRYTDLSALAQAPGPVVVPDDKGGVFIIRFEEIYDSRHDRTKNDLELYAISRSGDKSPARLEQYCRESQYIRFVSNMLIRKMIDLSAKP